MTTTLTYADLGLRVLLTALASAALGFDRSAEGHPAGVKTTMLVSLAACLAMLQANSLLVTTGKTPDSFVSFDVMRLPLGVLTGVGFIGGGAILKRDGDVVGLTTAATLWFVTMIGLCFGAGLLTLGVIGAAVGLLVLRGMKVFERRLRQRRVAELSLKWRAESFDPTLALETIASAGLTPSRVAMKNAPTEGIHELTCAVRRLNLPGDHAPPAEIAALALRPGVLEWGWKE